MVWVRVMWLWLGLWLWMRVCLCGMGQGIVRLMVMDESLHVWYYCWLMTVDFVSCP